MREGGESEPVPSGNFIYGGPERGADKVTYGVSGAIALDERDGGIIKFHIGDPGPARRADLVKHMIPTLQRLGLEYKVMSNSLSDSALLSVSQKGKFITAYPPSIENAAYVERELGAAMNRFARRHEAAGLGYVSPPFDYATPYPGLHWRYGGFQSDDVSAPTQRRGAKAMPIYDIRDATSVGTLMQRLDSETTSLREMHADTGHGDAAITAKRARVGALDQWARRAIQHAGGGPSMDPLPSAVRRPSIRHCESDADRADRVRDAIEKGKSQYWQALVSLQTPVAAKKHYMDVMSGPVAGNGLPGPTRVGPSFN